ncbi:hypothetical protein [Thalassospira xiamenensis]|uniref:hypothetical protein n=1 Tax=Thalassospira xiamenensis TaxID=220697 RepID=UPI000DED5634|nr:hypothetical protein [Thalassospira xiamenensis]
MKRTLWIALVAVLFFWLSHPTFAALVCGDRAKVIASLLAHYAEEPVAVGVTSNGGVIEVLSAPDGQTWTILFTRPDQVTCLLASGESWQDIAPVPASRGDPGDPA